MLAVFFGTWAPSRHFSRQAWLVHHARNNAEIFLDLLRQQKLEEAHQLHLHQNQRRESDVSLEEYYGSRPEARTDYDAFFSVPPLDELVPSAATATFSFQGMDAYVHEDYEDTLLLRVLGLFPKKRQEQERDHAPGDAALFAPPIRSNLLGGLPRRARRQTASHLSP